MTASVGELAFGFGRFSTPYFSFPRKTRAFMVAMLRLFNNCMTTRQALFGEEVVDELTMELGATRERPQTGRLTAE